MSYQKCSNEPKMILQEKSNFYQLGNSILGPTKVIFICATLMMASCKSDNEVLPKENDLIGEWSVFYSEMNDKPSDLLEEAHFNFKDGNVVESNLFDNKSYAYSVKEGGLYIDNPDQFLLGIEYFKNDTLILAGKLKYYNLKLKMVKLKTI